MENLEMQIEVVQRSNALMDKLHPVLVGQPVLVIYIASLLIQKSIRDLNPGIAQAAHVMVKDLEFGPADEH